jgi:hypothetical protein
MLVAKVRFKQASPERRQRLTYDDLIGWAGKRIASGLAASALNESSLPQNPHQLRSVGIVMPSAWLISGIVKLAESP